MDAAIACAFMQGVVDPLMSGIGGFGSMQLYMPGKGVHQIVEFYAKASLSATAEMWTDKLTGQSRDGFAFLLEGGVFTKDFIDAFIDLKMEEVMAYETMPHPIEYDLYYSA